MKTNIHSKFKKFNNKNENEQIRKRKSHNQKIRDAHLARQQEKQEAKKAREDHDRAVESALAQYKTKKQSRLKKLVKRTRRGQPVMKGQIDLLLEKIQREKNKEKKE